MALRVFRRVQRREVDQLLDPGLATGAGDGAGAYVVDVVELRIEDFGVASDAMMNAVGFGVLE